MASYKLIMPLLAVLLLMLLPLSTFSETTYTTVPRPQFYGIVCEIMGCGEGTCQGGEDYYSCNCNPGWKQTYNSTVPDNQKFRPCIVPNCKTNSTCQPSVVSQDKQPEPTTFNSSDAMRDPCLWVDCGGGTCIKEADYMYSCKCKDGYANLHGKTTYPCYSKCAFGSDCANIWSSGSSGNQAMSFVKFYGMTSLVMFVAMLLVKQ